MSSLFPGILDCTLYDEYALPVPEYKWNKTTNSEVVGTVNLTANRAVNGVWMREENASRLDLNGKLLTVGAGGINGYYSKDDIFVKGGVITASGAQLIFKSATYGFSPPNKRGEKLFYHLAINSEIRDHATHKVGITVKGGHPNGEIGLVLLTGNTSNTFTGDVIVEGTHNALLLHKGAGARAVQSKRIYVRSGGRFATTGDGDQINDAATVTLSGNGSMFSFTGAGGPGVVGYASEKVHALQVESGQGVFSFMHYTKFKDRYRKTIILDDLIINARASLRIALWEAGRDHFLVRKDSKHLADAMKKISIDGWAKNQVYLKNYNKEYWSIEAVPEPAVCGAILGLVGFGLWRWCRQKQRWHRRSGR